jgi:hypothetical protein
MALWVRRAQHPSGFTDRHSAIAGGDQSFLKLQPFVGRHGRFLAFRRQILYGRITFVFGRAGGTQRARPSLMSQLISRSRQAKRNTAEALR